MLVIFNQKETTECSSWNINLKLISKQDWARLATMFLKQSYIATEALVVSVIFVITLILSFRRKALYKYIGLI